jgi:hypothetical protein
LQFTGTAEQSQGFQLKFILQESSRKRLCVKISMEGKQLRRDGFSIGGLPEKADRHQKP